MECHLACKYSYGIAGRGLFDPNGKKKCIQFRRVQWTSQLLLFHENIERESRSLPVIACQEHLEHFKRPRLLNDHL